VLFCVVATDYHHRGIHLDCCGKGGLRGLGYIGEPLMDMSSMGESQKAVTVFGESFGHVFERVQLAIPVEMSLYGHHVLVHTPS
jgi:hypothetical protein